MSRIGKTPVSLPKGVEVRAAQEIVHIKGPKGSLELKLPPGLSIQVEGTDVTLLCNEQLVTGAEHGLFRALLKNHVEGVVKPYEVILNMIGVGYRAAVQGQKLDIQVGFSHPTFVPIPKGIEVTVDKGTTILIKGIDKRQVGQFAAAVRAVKPPEPYKGKGIRYVDEYVRKKEGKAAKGKA